MKKLTALMLVAVFALSGCGTLQGVSEEVREEAESLCRLYKELREPVVIARQGAVEHWDQFSPQQQKALAKVDEHLVDLDRAGKLTCAVAAGTRSGGVDWQAIKAILFDSVRLVVELQAQGIIKKL